MKVVIVFAGSYQEFKHFVHSQVGTSSPNVYQSNVKYVYPDRIEGVVGWKDPELVTVGTWIDNKKMIEAYEYCIKRYGKR